MKKIFILALVAILLFPKVSLAAWWNPMSWFEKENAPAIQQDINTEVETSLTDQSRPTTSTNEPTIQEKIVEKTITVDNPELQKKINDLLKQNSDLQLKVNSLTSSLNSCKISSIDTQQISTAGYSDFNFTYVVGVSKITFPFNTSRDIVIKKAVFHIKETGTKDTRKAGSIQRLELITSTGAKPIYYNLENNGSTFTFVGTGIPLKGKESLVVNVAIANPNDGKETDTFYMVPDFSQWEVWDNTTDKPVLVN